MNAVKAFCLVNIRTMRTIDTVVIDNPTQLLCL